MGKKNIRPLYVAIAVLLLIPVVYLLYKAAPQQSGGKSPPLTAEKRLGDTVTPSPTYENYLNLAVGYINKNQPEKSLALLEKAKSLKPDSAVVYNNLGVAYILLKRVDEGIAACRKALDLDPSFQLAKNNLNWGLSEKEKLKKK